MPESIKRSIAAGVKCIEHGHLMDEQDGAADGGEGHLAQHAAVAGDGDDGAAQLGPAEQAKMRK